MLTLGTRLKNIAFLLITVLVVGYIAARYADLSRFVGFRDYYTVKVELPQTGGLFTNSNVTYRGVSVGRVGPLKLTASGVEADLRIRDSAPKIPARLTAVVANLSAVGEEYIDLRPSGDDGPYLRDGSTVALADTKVPAPVTDLLTNLNKFSASVPLDSLRTVIDEFYKAFGQDSGQNLKVLLDTGMDFTETADDNASQTNQLIVDGQTVLKTQSDEGGAFVSFADSAKLLAGQIASSDTDLRRLIVDTPPATQQFSSLLRDLDPDFSVLLANLLTTSDVAVTRVGGLRQLMVRFPQAVAAGSTTITPTRTTFGLGLTFFSPLPCTKGYGGTTYRNGLDTSSGPPLNTAARCLMPASSGIDVRGPANAPQAGVVPPAARPGTLSGLSDSTADLPGALSLPGVGGAPADMTALLGLRR